MTDYVVKTELEKLVAEAGDFQEAVRRTHETLWGLLAGCYNLLMVVENDANQFAVLSKFAKDKGIKTRKTTSKPGLIVRVVFGDDYENLYSCSQTLKVAFAHKVPAEDFEDWLKDNGGIDKARRLSLVPDQVKPHKPATAAQKAEAAVNAFKSMKAKATFKYDGAFPGDGDLTVAVLRKNAHGGIEIVDFVRQEPSDMDKVWAAIGIELKYEAADDSCETSPVEDSIEAAANDAVSGKEAA